MATHGRGGLRRWVMGSVTDRVLHATTRPLLGRAPRRCLMRVIPFRPPMASNSWPRAILFDLDSTLISRGHSLMKFGERFAAHFADRLGGVTARGVAYGLSEVDGNGFRSHLSLPRNCATFSPGVRVPAWKN